MHALGRPRASSAGSERAIALQLGARRGDVFAAGGFPENFQLLGGGLSRSRSVVVLLAGDHNGLKQFGQSAAVALRVFIDDGGSLIDSLKSGSLERMWRRIAAGETFSWPAMSA